MPPVFCYLKDMHFPRSVLADDPVVVKPNQLRSAWPRCCSSLHELMTWGLGGFGACCHRMPWIDFWTFSKFAHRLHRVKSSCDMLLLQHLKPLVGQMVYGNLGNLSPLELHRHIRRSVGTVCRVVRWFERPRTPLISIAWWQWQPGKPGKPGKPGCPHEIRRICMNFPKFPVVFPHERGVIERLTSIGDRVHLCETMGTVEGFDEDGNWSKFIRFRQRLKCCMCEISIIASPQGACLFLGYLWLPNFQCNMQFHVSCERCKAQSQLLKVTSKWKCLMGSPSCGMRTNAWHPVVVKDCRSETETDQRAGSCGFFTMDFEGTKRIEKLYHHIRQFILKILKVAMRKQSSGPASMKTWGMPSKGALFYFEEVQSSFQTILPFFLCIQTSCRKIAVFNKHTHTHAIISQFF
jgi:predicted ester cyclase